MLESEYHGTSFGKHSGTAAARDGSGGSGRWADDLLTTTLETADPSGFATEEPPDEADGVVTAWIVYETGTGRGRGLLRLKEEENNLLPPGSFFPVAERYGMMEELDRWVVRELITRCYGGEGGPEHAKPALYCVNLSEAAVRSHSFARFVQKQLLDRHFDGHRLCFEIAEHDIAPWRADAARLISMLKPFGCRFTVDAFGSVKGSFAPLQGLAFDFVKIDGVVVQNILRQPAELAKVRAIVTVCHAAGMRTIAEFVEDPETLAALRAAGVDYAQGFGVARPAPLLDLIRDNAPALANAA